ncbi:MULTISPECIES: VWA domain-containing protein [unclassified Saccharopolyspora]|uniref:vWA domain-containing protein n=1 Tax=unclassified Saccharopolyspora TaxID=2646250 RepID=UPI001CD25805|nr:MULTISPECIES: VWA domain-containing protein [unclassified Saccharopolyspora]MCA1193521.1 VWA domain-containing protein [Saccharopolyspora sp. 6V]MCA1228218.1 VWA domain-containing protein [Saccharopolyspora sp. 6M]
MACGPDRVRAFLAATAHTGMAERSAVYWAGRVTLCADPADLARYDAAFAAWFGGAAPRPRAPAAPRRARIAPLEPGERQQESEEAEPVRAAAADEVLRHRDLAGLGEAEREHLRRLLATVRPDPPDRPAARWRRARHGPLDARATLRAVLRSGGEPPRLERRRRGRRARRVVLVVDVSGSMEPYADALLRFAHVVVRRAPASTEVFTLGTRLTRVTAQLRGRDPERALRAAAAAVPDFSGGTRLGEVLRAFLDRWGRRGTARGAVVVVFSDGWERGDPALLGEQLRHLRRLARAVIWANPHAGHGGYAPVQSGIAAALPHLDALVPGHSLGSLQRVWAEVVRLGGNATAVRGAEMAMTRRGAAEVGRA